ncbi:putative glycoside hydrolase [Bacillus gobiensis]|uniref:putative glycoside hydrolase n=1 Tax=Bacillus gobiensis TaxID=1441095 RepID=UPI003D190E23
MKLRRGHVRLNIILFCLLVSLSASASADEEGAGDVSTKNLGIKKLVLPSEMPRFEYRSGYEFEYPDAVRGIYVSGNSAGGSRFNELTKLVDETELNAMVIDVKNDHGNLTYRPAKESKYERISHQFIKDPQAMLKTLEEKKIYPIARIVVFKDSVLAKEKPEWSFKEKNGEVWTNGRGESFVNPFLKEVWDYNVDLAIEAAKMGFKEIQFDYVRFPEGFEKRDADLNYQTGKYGESAEDNVQKRVNAITDFVAYAKEKLKPYGVDVSVDIFGYSATIPEAPGIGQNFSKISSNVDVISSMIYPSHWTGYFGVNKPDLEPYKMIKEYSKVEKQKLEKLDNPPTSRPWLQDFTASYLGSGNYQEYGKEEVEDQIKALNEEGINEFLLWDAANSYSRGVDYTPLSK